LIFGHLQILDHVQDTDIRRMSHELCSFAETQGFCRAITFYEHVSGSQVACIEPTHELRRVDAPNVVVPSANSCSPTCNRMSGTGLDG